MSELLSSGLLLAYQDPLDRLYGYQLDEIPNADLNQLVHHDIALSGPSASLSKYTFNNKDRIQARNVDYNNSYLLRIYSLDHNYLITEAGISEFGVTTNRNSILSEADIDKTYIIPSEVNTIDDFISRIIIPIPELSVTNSNTYISTIPYNYIPFKVKHSGQHYAMVRYHHYIPYNIGFQYSGSSFIYYDIANITGTGYEYYISDKILNIEINDIQVDSVIKTPTLYIDYKLEVDGKLIHDVNNNYNTTEIPGINVKVGTNNIVYSVDINKFTLTQTENNFKSKVHIKYTIQIKNSDNNDIIDTNDIEFDIDLIDYSSYITHIVDTSGTITSGYINKAIKLDKTDPELITDLYQRAKLNLTFNNISLFNYKPDTNNSYYTYTSKINDMIKDKRGTVFTLNTKIESGFNSWNVNTESICYINDLFYNINNVNLTLFGAKSNSDLISLKYLESEVDAEKSNNTIAETKFLSDGPVTAKVKFTINRNANYLYAISTKISAVPNPTDIYFIAFKRNVNTYNNSNIDLYQFDAKTTSHKSQRGVSELDYFPNVNTNYGQKIIAQIDNIDDTIYVHKSIPPQNLPYIFEKEEYTMSLDIPDNGEYAFYIIINNDMIGTTSHCVSNTDIKNINFDAYYDIPWRF